MVGRDYVFKFTDEEYSKYENWCKENKLNGYGGTTSFEITPTALGEVVVAYAHKAVMDELGEPSYDSKGKIKQKRIECVIRDII